MRAFLAPIAIQRGTLDPDRVVIMSGDIDSRIPDVMDATSQSPSGDSEMCTLEKLVIDNDFFGVASVSKDGYEGPVVFPGPAGSFGD